MGRLYDIIQAHIDAQQHGASVRRVAEALGVSPTTVANWRDPKELPKREHLASIARVTGTPYDDVFYAAGVDTGYIIETEGEVLDLVAGMETGRIAARETDKT